MKTLSAALGEIFTPAKVSAPRRRHKTRKQLDVIAASMSMTIDKDSAGGYWVIGGPVALNGDRFCSDLAEVQDLLETAANAG